MKRAAVLISSVVAVVGLGACADVTTSALEVNGRSFDRTEINDLLQQVHEEVQDTEALAVQLAAGQGTVVTELSGPVLNLLIQNEVLHQATVAQDVSVSEDDIAAAQAESQPTGSATVDRILAELNARGAALEGAGVNPAQLMAEVDVRVDPRYGQWSVEAGSLVANQGPGSESTAPSS